MIKKRTGELRSETVYGLSSLTESEANAQQLLTLVRQHWPIENKSHWVRDVTFHEDHSQVRRGRLPHIMATLPNAVISLLRAHGMQQIAKALRRFAARPDEALRLVGIPA